MVREKNAKIASLACSAGVIILYFCGLSVAQYGIGVGASFMQRLSFHFFHASALHVFMNVWVFLSVVFIFDLSLWSIITAFIIGSLFPCDTLYAIFPSMESLLLPTVGLSGVCYALMGRVAFMVQRKWYYQAWLCFYIGLGFLFPNMNAWIHLYCYIAGMGIGLLNKPLK